MNRDKVSTFIFTLGGEEQELTVNVSDYWQTFSQKSQQEQHDEMRGNYFWLVMAPHLAPSERQGEIFLSELFGGKDEREKALSGAKGKKRTKEDFIYQIGKATYLTDHPYNLFDERPSTYQIVDSEGRSWGEAGLAEEISKLIGAGDHQALRRLADLVEERGAINPRANLKEEQELVPQWSEIRLVQRWKEFCDYVIEYCQLPSVAQLNNRWNGGNKTTEYRKNLGLEGIPKS
jgi:hypothetical protein